MSDVVSKAALRYYGSKWSLAGWIYSYLPKHEHRVIPFAGSLSDTLQWPVPKLETVSDLDGRVYNFFTVLRERPDELVRAIRLTPWHEREYELSRCPGPEPLEEARRFWVTCWMSVQGGPNPGKSGFRYMKSREKRFTITPMDGMSVEHLLVIAERLKRIQFLNRDALEVMERFVDEPKALMYLDPPYVIGERTTTEGYVYDGSEQLHVKIAELAQRCCGYVVVCGYPSALYDRLYEGWIVVERVARVNGGGSKMEILWISPRTWDALQSYQDMPLFGYRNGMGDGV